MLILNLVKQIKQKTFIIAEAGVNHNGSLKKALLLAKIAKNCGADAVKFQLYDIEEQISTLAKNAQYQKEGSKENNMLKMAKTYDLSWDSHYKIKKYCDKINIKYLSSCFDLKAVDFLTEKLKCNIIKIGSGEITNLKLLKHCAKKKNVRIILSTGMANIEEIKKATKIIKKNLTLLHCISIYPANENIQNLNTINLLKKKFKVPVGFSDHTNGYEAAIIAVALKSQIIEKHFTSNKNLKGPDHKMSLNPEELNLYISKIRQAEKILGISSNKKNISKEEIMMMKIARRSVISIRSIKAGERLTVNNISIKRPLLGIDASKFENVLNKKILISVKANTPITWKMIKK